MRIVSEHHSDGLGAIDRAAVDRFFEQYIDGRRTGAAVVLADVFQFGDSAEMADQLLALVVDGPKRATASCRLVYADDGGDLPEVGDLSVVCDGRGQPRAVVETTDVRVGPLVSVDDQFAWDEGEGDRTRDDWLEMHSRYFARAHPEHWGDYGDDLPVVFERFELRCPEPGTGR